VRIPTLVCCLLAVMAGPLGARQANPQTQEARVVDPEALADALTSRYPVAFEGYGIGGTVLVRTFVRADGKADSTYVASSSGVPELDRAARSVVGTASFHPALEDGREVGSWLSLALTFGRANGSRAAHRSGDHHFLGLREGAAYGGQLPLAAASGSPAPSPPLRPSQPASGASQPTRYRAGDLSTLPPAASGHAYRGPRGSHAFH
jgi:periplasmic protein TonB